jgi:hypothetical protein
MANGFGLMHLARNLGEGWGLAGSGLKVLLDEMRWGNTYFLKMQDTDGEVIAPGHNSKRTRSPLEMVVDLEARKRTLTPWRPTACVCYHRLGARVSRSPKRPGVQHAANERQLLDTGRGVSGWIEIARATCCVVASRMTGLDRATRAPFLAWTPALSRMTDEGIRRMSTGESAICRSRVRPKVLNIDRKVPDVDRVWAIKEIRYQRKRF